MYCLLLRRSGHMKEVLACRDTAYRDVYHKILILQQPDMVTNR